MEATLLVWSFWGGGGHELLSTIPYFVGMHNERFGIDVQELIIEVHCDLEIAAVTDTSEAPYDYFSDRLSIKPSARFGRGSGSLKIQYTSKFLPFENDMPFGRYPLERGSTRGCNRLEKFVKELAIIFCALGPNIEQQCDFDWQLMVELIERKFAQLPCDDEGIARLNYQSHKRHTIVRKELDAMQQLNQQVSWEFTEKPYRSWPEFEHDVQSTSELVFGISWNPDEIVLKAPRFRLVFEQFEEDGLVQYELDFEAADGESFSAGELLFTTHQRIAHLIQRRQTAAFFEGFMLQPDKSADGNLPVYRLVLGS